jgi:hypothetical protein
MIPAAPERFLGIPLDGLLGELKSRRCYTLGLASSQESVDGGLTGWVEAVAERCARKTGRKTLLIRGASSPHERSVWMAEDARPSIDTVDWKPWSVPMQPQSPEGKVHLAELSSLPGYKLRYGLLAIDLGSIDSAIFSGLGKICDGIGIGIFPGTSARRGGAWVRSLQRHQRLGAKVLGLWTVEYSHESGQALRSPAKAA